jgi:hypothetical protein
MRAGYACCRSQPCFILRLAHVNIFVLCHALGAALICPGLLHRTAELDKGPSLERASRWTASRMRRDIHAQHVRKIAHMRDSQHVADSYLLR